MTSNDTLSMILADHEGWEHDGYGYDSNLICPCGDTIELDGECPQGCVSPLIQMGMI
jgi:hypothetical protein